MNLVLQSSQHTLLSVSAEELRGITSALNEVCNGIQVPEASFETRLGASRESLRSLLVSLLAEPHSSRRASESNDVWSEQGSLMIRVVSVFGDPVELGEHEALAFAERVQQAARAT